VGESVAVERVRRGVQWLRSQRFLANLRALRCCSKARRQKAIDEPSNNCY